MLFSSNKSLILPRRNDLLVDSLGRMTSLEKEGFVKTKEIPNSCGFEEKTFLTLLLKRWCEEEVHRGRIEFVVFA